MSLRSPRGGGGGAQDWKDRLYPIDPATQLYGGPARPRLTARCVADRGVSLLSVCVPKYPLAQKNIAATSLLSSLQFGLGEGDVGGAGVARASELDVCSICGWSCLNLLVEKARGRA